ncbi:MAG: AsmA-like C-terminal region-containing protein, partial [Elusimicrobiota bacterium]|nr:AsmA-like C-terminal region-containing protein [Elusimicrobiota bacterium]
MKKALKIILPRIILLPLIFFALLLGGGFIVVKTMLNSSNMRAILTDQLQKTFKRTVTFSSAKISLSGKIKLQDLKIFSAENKTREKFISSDIVYVSCKLLPLLKKTVALDKIYLIAPKINLIKDKNGLWNFSDIFENSKKSNAHLTQIKKAEIKNGLVKIKDSQKNVAYALNDVTLAINNFELFEETPFSFSALLKLKNPYSLKGRFYCEGLINTNGFNWKKAYIKNMEITSTVLGKSITTRLSVNNLKYPKFKLAVDARKIKTKLPLNFKKTYELNIEHLKAHMNAALSEENKLTINSSGIKSRGLALAAAGTVVISTPAPKYNLNLSAKPFPLSELNIIFPETPFGKAAGTGEFKVDFNNSANNEIHIKRLSLNTKKAGFNYRKIRFSNLNINAHIRENLKNNRFTLKKGSFILTKNTVKNLDIKTDINSKLMTTLFEGRWNNHKAKGILKIKNPLTQKKSLNLTAYSENLNATKLRDIVLEIKYALPPKEKRFHSRIKWVSRVKNAIPRGFSFISGNIKALAVSHEYFKSKDFYLSAKLKNFSGNVEKIKGEISIKSGAGTFFKVHETSQKDRIYNIVALPVLMIFKMNRMSALKLGATLKDVSFYSVGGEYSFDAGKIHIKNFYMDGKEFSAYSTGDLDLMNETMDLKVYTISNKYYSMGTLPQFLTDASGKPAIAFRLTGKMNKPDFKMLNPKKSGKIIKDAKNKGVKIDISAINKMMGGVK